MNAARTISNFGSNVHFQPAGYFEPHDEADVISILNQCRDQQIRVIGSLHAWSDLVVTEGIVLNVTRLQQIDLQPDGESAWVGAGCQIKRVIAELKRKGRTLPSLGLITEQTIAGATSTGTHGSGRHCLSNYIQAVRVARFDPATGQAMIEQIEAGDELRAAKCGLGCLGVIVSLKVQCRQRYSIEEHIREYPSLESVLDAQEQFPLQQFYLAPWRWTYLAQHRREVPLKRSLLAGLYRIYWFLMIDLGLHLLILFALRIVRSSSFVRFLYRRVIPRTVIYNWKVTDESSAMLIMEHELFRHIEIELFVTRSRLEPALNYVRDVLTVAANPSANSATTSATIPDQEGLEALRGIYCHHYPICVRRVVSDDMLISMASGGNQDWYAISIISYARPTERAGFQAVAAFLAKSMSRRFGARPHWGKYCPLPAEDLVGLYPEFGRFRQICEDRDPQGRFRNRWMTELFHVTSTSPES
ncbi:MAG: FAD-binding protein [Planctomycetaceae bacterium]